MDSEAYWAKRAEEREAAWQNKSRETLEKELAASYEASLDHIQRNIDALYGRFAKDNNLSVEEGRKLLTGKEYRTWRMSLEEYVAKIDAGDKMLERELNTLAMRSRISRFDKLYSETLMELDGLGRKTRDRMDGFLGDAYRDNYYRGLYEIGHVGKALPAISQVDSKSVEAVLRTPWSGKNYSTRIWKNQKQLAQVIQDEVVASVHQGEDVRKVSRRVAEKMGVGLSNAQRLVRTELNYVHNQAALDSIRDAEMDYFRFVATLDSRTSTMCREHDGKIYPIDSADTGENIPPLHPRCRSIIVGSLGGKELKGKTRIAKGDDGKYIHVPAEMNYEDFQKVYVEKTQTVDEWKEARGPKSKTVDAELLRRKRAEDGHEIIDQPTYNKLTREFVKKGGLIIRGEEAAAHLEKVGATASYIPGLGIAFIRDDATISDVLEEMYHAEQQRRDLFGVLRGTRDDEKIYYLREIDAQKYLIKVAEKFKIPIEEQMVTKKNLDDYIKALLKWEAENNEK